MKLAAIPDWRRSWRFHSVQVAAVLTLLSLAQAQLLPQIEPIVPPKYWPYVTAGLGVLIWVMRIVQQELDAAAKQPPAQPEEPRQ